MRIPLWMDWHKKIFNNFVVPLDFDENNIRGRVEIRRMGIAQMAKIRPATQRIIKRKHSDIEKSSMTVILQLEGSSLINDGFNEVLLSKEDLIFFVNSELEKKIHPDSEMFILNIPMHLVNNKMPSLVDYSGISFLRENPEVELIKNALCGAYSLVPKIKNTQQQNLLNSIIDLLAITEPDDKLIIGREKRIGQALKYIDTYINENEFNAEKLAELMNLSRRRLDDLFKNDLGESVSEYIWRKRLEKSLRMLEDISFKDLSITEIAISNGFSDISHFSRTFSKKYGASPINYRKK